MGAERLLEQAWFAVTEGSDPVAEDVVAALGGRSIVVADDPSARALHHAACCVASSHLVGLLAQVERLAATIGAPVDAYLALARGSLDNVAALGTAAAMTGPIARGDHGTIARHRAALDGVLPGERPLYDALVVALEELARCR